MSFNIHWEEVKLSLKIIQSTLDQQFKIIENALQEMKTEAEQHVWIVQHENEKNGTRPEEWKR